jgi:hypothetical protein
MRILRTIVIALALSSTAAHADDKATAVGKQLWAALGGDDGWQHARYLRFDWIVERPGKPPIVRSHYWDRWSGRYRVDGEDKEGAYRVYFNVNTKKGEAWIGGKKLSDAAQAKKWVDDGYEAFINDSYWLLAPFKIFDPGVNLGYAGEDKGPNGEVCDVLKLTFGNDVGLTPKDMYWLFVDKKSHLVVEWKYVLDGKNDAPTAWTWSDWKKVGSIMLAPMRKNLGKPSVIRFDKLTVSSDVDDAALTPPK